MKPKTIDAMVTGVSFGALLLDLLRASPRVVVITPPSMHRETLPLPHSFPPAQEPDEASGYGFSGRHKDVGIRLFSTGSRLSDSTFA
jgi:hypothetical protein